MDIYFKSLPDKGGRSFTGGYQIRGGRRRNAKITTSCTTKWHKREKGRRLPETYPGRKEGKGYLENGGAITEGGEIHKGGPETRSFHLKGERGTSPVMEATV